MLARRSVLAGLAATGIASSAFAASRVDRFGIQLYSLREVAKTDPLGTLRRLKTLGYSEVELGGPPYSTMDPRALRAQLDRIGLRCPAMHVQMAEFDADTPKVLAQANTLGARYVVLPWIAEDRRSTIAQAQASAAMLTKLGTAAKAADLVFAYHNHSWEFEPIAGRLPFDIFFGESDPALVKIELDLFWAAKTGADIPALFARYPGRIPLCHVKDMTASGEMTTVGAGTLDFAALFAKSPQAGLLHYFVEHDDPPAPYWPTFEGAARNLRKLRF